MANVANANIGKRVKVRTISADSLYLIYPDNEYISVRANATLILPLSTKVPVGWTCTVATNVADYTVAIYPYPLSGDTVYGSAGPVTFMYGVAHLTFVMGEDGVWDCNINPQYFEAP